MARDHTIGAPRVRAQATILWLKEGLTSCAQGGAHGRHWASLLTAAEGPASDARLASGAVYALACVSKMATARVQPPRILHWEEGNVEGVGWQARQIVQLSG